MFVLLLGCGLCEWCVWRRLSCGWDGMNVDGMVWYGMVWYGIGLVCRVLEENSRLLETRYESLHADATARHSQVLQLTSDKRELTAQLTRAQQALVSTEATVSSQSAALDALREKTVALEKSEREWKLKVTAQGTALCTLSFHCTLHTEHCTSIHAML